ncbi:hypothetical protein TELCIR_18125 [Teladorsagia circumcincta]|uniref:Uncharacterized protein n=1 Tax=Teladorsagia circumcincta TaxID=45464 RepID=A0A2G9TQU7_TELCI|nr:hypothetical protein TELCIR_18125 [Teladorsagia circumcincta]
MTTPKMLGLRKKGLSNSGGSHPYRKTPTGICDTRSDHSSCECAIVYDTE